MFEKITPEQAGISSKIVSKFIQKLEKSAEYFLTEYHGILIGKSNDNA